MNAQRLDVLDGWRGISILLVLMGHLMPLGHRAWELNGAVAGMGMAVFFTLSGFLITSVLLRDDSVRRFLIHRVMRIVPLAWLAATIVLLWRQADIAIFAAHLLFYANEVPWVLNASTGHFWSLCVEVQFYVFVALLVGVGGRWALYLLPLLGLGVTAYRVHENMQMVINTQFRVDEILAGALMALLYQVRREWFDARWLLWVPWVALPLLLAAAHPTGGRLNFARPYIAALLVGSTLGSACGGILGGVLRSRVLKYMARVSYALYVIHGCLMGTWLNEGGTLVKYLKRPVFFLLTFGLAELSTRYYEKFFIDLGHRWAGRRPRATAEWQGVPQDPSE